MVKVWLDATCTEVPIADVISKGLPQFFSDISVTNPEYKDLTSFDNFRLYYNANELKEEDLKTITDDDALRVFVLPEKDEPSQKYRKEVTDGIHALTAPLRNPEDRRINGFNYEFATPDHMTKIMKHHPKLCRDPRFVAVLKDWYLFRGYIVRDDYKEDPKRNEFKFSNPEFYSIVKRLVITIAANYGIRYIERPAVDSSATPQPITQALLQNALQAALSGARLPGVPLQQAPAQRLQFPSSSFGLGPSSGSSSGTGPSSSSSFGAGPSSSQSAEEPMEQGFEQQAAMLRSFGFENDELIQLALEQSNGDIETAMEFLIEMNN